MTNSINFCTRVFVTIITAIDALELQIFKVFKAVTLFKMIIQQST